MKIVVVLAVAALGGCATAPTPEQAEAAQVGLALASAFVPGTAQLLDDAQLVCQAGSVFNSLVDVTTGKPILAKGQTAGAVRNLCGLVGGSAPVALPAGVLAVPVAVNPVGV